MKRNTKYVGLDVHQATTVASVREEGGRVLARAVFPTEESAITEFFGGMRGAVHVALEEGTQAQWLHELLSPRVDRVVVCDQRGQPRHGNKGDRSDADGLSELLRRGGLRSVYHGSSHRATLKELARTYQNLVGDCTRVMQRIKALFRARGIKTPGSSVYTPGSRREWLAQLPEGGVRFRAEDTLCTARYAAGIAPKGQDGHAGRGPSRSRLGPAANDPVLRAGPCGAGAGRNANTLAISDQAKPVVLRRVCGG